eukprot:1960872-Pleurochrysis_carterae.AAC.2
MRRPSVDEKSASRAMPALATQQYEEFAMLLEQREPKRRKPNESSGAATPAKQDTKRAVDFRRLDNLQSVRRPK